MRVNVHLRTVHLRLSFTADTNELTKSRTTDKGGLDVCMICVVKIVIKIIIVYDCCSTYLFAATVTSWASTQVEPSQRARYSHLPGCFLSAQSFSENLMNGVLPAETVMLLWTSTVVASFFCLSVSYFLRYTAFYNAFLLV